MYVGDELSCAKPVKERKKIDLGASQVKGAAFRIKRFHGVVTSFGEGQAERLQSQHEAFQIGK